MILPSFTESKRRIDFDEATHVYTDLDNKDLKMVSGTGFLGQFKKPFNVDRVAGYCSKSWKEDKQDIKDMWGSNGKASADFGSAIHYALEHYVRYYFLDSRISSLTGVPNRGMPKHPILRDVIDKFDKTCPFKEERLLRLPEIFVSSGYLCGQVDLGMINRKDKYVRILDYKVNVGSKDTGKVEFKEPFTDLPSCKLTSYLLQMSFYGALITYETDYKIKSVTSAVLEDDWEYHTDEINDTMVELVHTALDNAKKDK